MPALIRPWAFIDKNTIQKPSAVTTLVSKKGIGRGENFISIERELFKCLNWGGGGGKQTYSFVLIFYLLLNNTVLFVMECFVSESGEVYEGAVCAKHIMFFAGVQVVMVVLHPVTASSTQTPLLAAGWSVSVFYYWKEVKKQLHKVMRWNSQLPWQCCCCVRPLKQRLYTQYLAAMKAGGQMFWICW